MLVSSNLKLSQHATQRNWAQRGERSVLSSPLVYMVYSEKLNKKTSLNYEASRGAGAQNVTVNPTGCGFDPHSWRCNSYLNLYFHFFVLVSRQSAALSSATELAMLKEFVRSSFSFVYL